MTRRQIFAVLVIVTALLAGTWAVGRVQESTDNTYSNIERFIQVLTKVRDHSVEPVTSDKLMDSAIRKVKGKIEDKAALRAAIKAADFKSVRGDFKFGPNHFPVQNYYLQLVGRGNDGKLMHKTIGTVLQNRADAYVQDCKMK